MQDRLEALRRLLDSTSAASGSTSKRVQMTWDGQMKTVADMVDENMGTFESFKDMKDEAPHMRGFLLLSPDHRQLRLVTQSRWSPQAQAWEDVNDQETIHIDAQRQRYAFEDPRAGQSPHLQYLGGGGIGTFSGKVLRAA